MSENNQQPKTQEQLLHDVETLLQRNEEILKRVKRYLFWAQILGSVKILLIVLPLIAAAYFLPTLMEQFTNMYKNAGIVPNGGDILEGLEQYRNFLPGSDVLQ
ncbi:MAG TPA: hypothetical protein VJB93_00325 [Patescibacteria group bacterium]|nr:hypothetical protein [Patescibacteria group bacterium]